MSSPTTTRLVPSPTQGRFSRREFRIQRLSTNSGSPSLPKSLLSSTKEECCLPSPLPMMKTHRPGLFEWRRATGGIVDRPRMTRIGLYSEDRSLHPLLSSALGKDFEVLLQSDGDEDGCPRVHCRLRCDDPRSLFLPGHTPGSPRIYPALDRLQCPGHSDGRRQPAFHCFRTRSFGRIWLLSPPAIDSRPQDHARPGL